MKHTGHSPQTITWREKATATLGTLLISIYFASIFISSSGEIDIEDALVRPLNCQDQSWRDLSASFKDAKQNCPSVAEVVVDIQSIETSEDAQINANFRIWPAGTLGSATVNTGIAQRALDINYENKDVGDWYVAAKRLIGGRSVSIPLSNRSNIENYPFDQYIGDWQARITPAGEYSPFLTTLTVADRDLYGWTVKVTGMKFDQDQEFQKVVNSDGEIGFNWQLQRSGTLKISVAILVLVMVLGVFAAIVLTTSILRSRRPPTLNALSWLATSLFALVEIRSRFPGGPPLGIRMDLIFTYPTVALLLFLIVLHTYLWVKRDDWNLKNTYVPPA